MNWRKNVDDFKAQLKAEPPVISASAIRVGFFGLSGGGKSVTAGIFAVGITPSGLIGWVDGEGRRSPWAIDIVAGLAEKHYGGTKDAWKDRFTIIHIDPPFDPLRVVAATEALEEMGCKTIILDILSQCWRGDGGYLDMKADEVDKMIAANPRTTEQRVASSASAHIKPWTHDKLVNKVTHSRSNLVLLFQAKQKFDAKVSKPQDFVTPIQESGITTTAIAVGRVECNAQGQGGFCSFELPSIQGAKHTHPSILAALPRNGEQFRFEHAESILKLCGGSPISQARETLDKPVAPSPEKIATEATRNWMLEQLKDIHLQAQEYAIDKGYIDPNDGLDSWNLKHVPTNKASLRALRSAIENH